MSVHLNRQTFFFSITVKYDFQKFRKAYLQKWYDNREISRQKCAKKSQPPETSAVV